MKTVKLLCVYFLFLSHFLLFSETPFCGRLAMDDDAGSSHVPQKNQKNTFQNADPPGFVRAWFSEQSERSYTRAAFGCSALISK